MERRIELSDEQIRLLERFSPGFRERKIETRTPATWWSSTPFLSTALQLPNLYNPSEHRTIPHSLGYRRNENSTQKEFDAYIQIVNAYAD